jgi:uncharacterized protein involved in exopolysaccharide biosynthesis
MTYHDILHLLLFNKNKILKITIVSFLIFFLGVLFVLPRTYTSTVSILPPEKNPGINGLGTLLAGADFTSLLGVGGLSSATSQLYMEMLKSRSASEYVIKKLDLIEYLGADDLPEACEELSKRIRLDLNKEGILKVEVETKTPILPLIFGNKDSTRNLAAELSNTFVEALDKINRQKLSSKAKNARQYIDEQLLITKSKLDSAEVALMNFQQKNKTISLPDQLKAVIEGAAQLKTEIVETEVEIGLLQSNLREDNRTLISLRDKLANLQKQYSKMEIGNQDFLIAFRDVPELGRELASLLRDVKIQNEVYLILQQQYYKEKIQENKDIPTIEVLDKAIPPKNPVSPKILITSLFGGLFILFLTSVIFVISEKKNLKTNS